MRKLVWLLVAFCSAGMLGGCIFPGRFVPRPR